MDELCIEDLPPALFVRPEGKVPSYSLREAAMFWPAADDDLIFNRLKGLAQRRLIHQRQRRGTAKTSPGLFGVDDLAGAAALMAIFDAGVADSEVLTFASNALYAWDPDLNPYR